MQAGIAQQQFNQLNVLVQKLLQLAGDQYTATIGVEDPAAEAAQVLYSYLDQQFKHTLVLWGDLVQSIQELCKSCDVTIGLSYCYENLGFFDSENSSVANQASHARPAKRQRDLYSLPYSLLVSSLVQVR